MIQPPTIRPLYGAIRASVLLRGAKLIAEIREEPPKTEGEVSTATAQLQNFVLNADAGAFDVTGFPENMTITGKHGNVVDGR